VARFVQNYSSVRNIHVFRGIATIEATEAAAPVKKLRNYKIEF